MENESTAPLGTPSKKQQQWGLLISIVVIVLMIVIGAFYSWDNRVKEQQEFLDAVQAQ